MNFYFRLKINLFLLAIIRRIKKELTKINFYRLIILIEKQILIKINNLIFTALTKLLEEYKKIRKMLTNYK